ncbi:MAG: tyrosine-type recombinase/integrase [Chitinophagales bacterium]
MNLKRFLDYLKYEKRYSPHTLDAYRSDLEQFLLFLQQQYESPAIEELSHHHIRSWMVALIEGQKTAVSINRKLSSLKSYFRFAMREGLLKSNPAAKIQAPKQGKKLPTFVEEKQIAKLFDDIPFPEGYIGCRDKLILECFYALGLRRAELIALKESDFSLPQRTLRVTGKGRKERLLPFDQKLGESIENYLLEKKAIFQSETPAFFVTEKAVPLYPKLVYQIVNKYLSLVTTLKKKSPHILRHTFATHLLNNGADINAIKELLGHSSLAATQVYTHNDIQKLKSIYKQAHPKA